MGPPQGHLISALATCAGLARYSFTRRCACDSPGGTAAGPRAQFSTETNVGWQPRVRLRLGCSIRSDVGMAGGQSDTESLDPQCPLPTGGASELTSSPTPPSQRWCLLKGNVALQILALGKPHAHRREQERRASPRDARGVERTSRPHVIDGLRWGCQTRRILDYTIANLAPRGPY